MVPQERLKTVEFTSVHMHALKEFCNKCLDHGLMNNSSIDTMRLEWCLEQGGQFYLTYLDSLLISISGCHPLPQAGADCYRVLFRGATLLEYQNLFKIVSKTHMSSIPFFSHIPLQVKWANTQGYSTPVVTTNWANPDGITSMTHSHKVFQLLARQGLVTCLEEKINIFNTEQSVWKINLDEYTKARLGYGKRNGLS